MFDVSESVVVKNALGIHARPAATLARRASEFESEIYLRYDDNLVNAKSIMGLLTLGAAHGTVLIVHCKGPDATEALASVKEIFESGFGEP